MFTCVITTALEFQFFILICLSFIKSNLEALYRGRKAQSQRHTIQKSCYYWGHSFQQKSLAPSSLLPSSQRKPSVWNQTDFSRKAGKNPGARMSEKHGAAPGREKQSRPTLMLAMESVCFTRTHWAAFEPLIIRNTNKQVNSWHSEDNKCLSMCQRHQIYKNSSPVL